MAHPSVERIRQRVTPIAPNVLMVGARGPVGCGKDTFLALVAKHLELKGARPVRRSLGDPLKEEVAAFGVTLFKDHPDFAGMTKEQVFHQLLDWQHGATRPEKERFRLLMQWWGTEYRRGFFGQDYWTERLKDFAAAVGLDTPQQKVFVLVTDVRFPDEAKVVQQYGVLAKIQRNGCAFLDHPSERALDNFTGDDVTVFNNQDLDSLEAQAETLAAHLLSLL